ncbi:PREDICTED: uncharacterized protein LOC104810716 isoform X2 [Tarenaya hassleriana]|uniref:uncharacterized protein LOC104810716 isoform X2 n=1 Tax=Tarenaya hassleriana TaxID=28532 RepID=UPI00053C40C8|nr:PREDICTED: uncharacterized protein LOC104810716 isoform X2 [Tarenaya hassleriana]XP_010535390.1 PREDICTED: uncharacterized protein LOC104810716 isoform X2 [Tarenaya hassleriana]
MEVKVATTSLQWSARHAVFPQCPSSSQTLASSKCRRHCGGGGGDLTTGGSLACHYRPRPMFNNSAFPGNQSSKLHRSKSCDLWEFSKTPTTKKHNPIRRVCSATSNFYSDEEFSKQIQELALKFRIAGDEEDERKNKPEITHGSADDNGESYRYGTVELLQESVSGLHSMEPPWPEMVNHSSFLRKANSVGLPQSLRIIRRKLQEEGLREASESAYCSVNRAFSSMVFMIEEINSFTLQTREAVVCEDLQGVLRRVRKDMHASFLWLFQCVFSDTPTLMVYVMLLLANFTVHSMGSNRADERVEASPHMPSSSRDEESCVGEREMGVWKSMVEEAERMGERIYVSAIEAKIEMDGYEEYERTEEMYEKGLAEEPDNPLLLANYAQFLYLVSGDYDRAEEYFERATGREGGGDAEAYNKYGNFMWRGRKDEWGAEEKFLEAISMEPTNPFYAANYAHFLWNTGADDTCFPIS